MMKPVSARRCRRIEPQIVVFRTGRDMPAKKSDALSFVVAMAAVAVELMP